MEIIRKFSVNQKVEPSDKKELFEPFLLDGEEILLSYKDARDRVVFTNKKIMVLDIQGLTGKRREYRFFPYSKIASYSVETAGFMDMDAEFKLWISGVGCYEIKFYGKIDVKEVAQQLVKMV